jgi:tight adherence protein B
MNLVLFLIIAVIAIGVPIVIYLMYSSRPGDSRAVLDRVRQLQEEAAPPTATPGEEERAQRDFFPTVERLISGASFTQRLMDEMARAGWRLKPSEYVGIALGSIGVGAIAGMVIAQSSIGALGGAFIGWAIPKTMLTLAVGRRKAALESQIPDMVWLISSALKSGYSFLKAMQTVANEMRDPIAEASQRVVDESRLGVPMDDALQRMAARVGSPDLDLIVTAVSIQSQVGGSLAEVLDSIADTIKERVQLQGEVSALTAEGRMSGIVLIMLTPAMAAMLTIANPVYMSSLISDQLGIKLIIGTAIFQILGIVIIKRMMKIDISRRVGCDGGCGHDNGLHACYSGAAGRWADDEDGTADTAGTRSEIRVCGG